MALDGGESGNEGGGDAAAALLGGAGGGDQGGGDQGGGDKGAGDQSGGGDGDGGFAEPEFLKAFSAEADGEGGSNRDWLKAKGFKDLDGIAKSLRSAEREITTLKTGGGGLKVPGEGATEEEKIAFNKAIGVPDDPKGYEIKPPEGLTAEQLNGPLLERLSAAAHKAGLPKAGFEAVVGDYIQAQLDEQHAAIAAQDEQAAAKLKEWGAAKDEKLAAVNTAMRTLGLTAADAAYLRGMPGGAGRALDLMEKLGSGMGEDFLTGGGGGRGFGISLAEAQAELKAQNTTPGFMEKAMVKGSPEAIRRERLLAVVAANMDKEQAG